MLEDSLHATEMRVAVVLSSAHELLKLLCINETSNMQLMVSGTNYDDTVTNRVGNTLRCARHLEVIWYIYKVNTICWYP